VKEKAGGTGQKVKRALASVLRTFADPIRLKVRTGLRSGGVDVNHSRRVRG
jgi:hypothetical protein